MMKGIPYILIFILLAQPLQGENPSLRLRVGEHGEFVRIVFEGNKDLIDKAIVNQKGDDILIRFPLKGITIQTEGSINIKHRMVEENAILLSPGNPRRLRVSHLQNPDRLVIDAYLEGVSMVERMAEPISLKTIVIDPGHGGYEHGIVKGDYIEKNITLDIAKRLGSIINRGKSKAILTRDGDLYMSINERVRSANDKDADAFISLHIGNHKELIIYTPVETETIPDYIKRYILNKGQTEYLDKSLLLGNALKEAFSAEFGKEGVMIKPLPYSILSGIEAPAIMIEMPSPDGTPYTQEFRSLMADIIYKGISNYEKR